MLTERPTHIVNDWIRDYSDVFYDYLCNRLSDTNAAKDILQETFIAAWKSSIAFKNNSAEKTWLFSILKNKLIDHFRRQGKLEPTLNTAHYFDEKDHWSEVAAPISWRSADYFIDKKEFYSVLNKWAGKLTQLQRQTFSMKYLDDHDTAYICKVMKITPSNYWVLIHRSKLEIRSCLTKNWFVKK